MSFNTFCNICFIKQNIIKLNGEENEHIFNILISLASCSDIVQGIIYLCINCCNKLEEYDKFRQLFLTNFVRFRYLYNEQKEKLEILNEPDIETQLKTFVEVNLERPSGTPLIENCEAAQALRNNSSCNVDITCKEPDEKICKIELDELSDKNIAENETQSYHVNEEQKIYGSTLEYDEPNPYRFEEPQDPLASDTISNVIPCRKSTNDNICGLSTNSRNFETVDIKIEQDEPNPYRFEEPQDPLASDTIPTISRNFETVDIKIEQGVTDEANGVIKSRTHIVEKTYLCDECNKTFPQISQLLEHKRHHSGEKPFECDVCGLGFTRRDYLNIHKRKHTGERPYRCDECHKTFPQSIHLIEHKRTHSGEKPHKCDQCGIGFAQRSQLNSHKRTHTGERPFRCDLCDKTFTRHSYLIEHKRIHNGEKPHKCEECGVGFLHRKNLNIHKRKHTGERPYSCNECHKTFSQSTSLIVHKRVHSGEKPYKCDQCGFAFAQLSQLNKHKRTHTGERPYPCDECQKAFADKYCLIRHKRTHNKQQLDI